MGWTVNEMPDQVGRVALVTGANSGLGLATTKALVSIGARVIMGCRSIAKAKAASLSLLEAADSGAIDFLKIDLGDLTEVNRAADQLLSKYPRLDLLINNAGVMAPPRTLSKQGFEIQFAVHHLGHMALTLKLMPFIFPQYYKKYFK